ncbi:MAG: hypothetical protein WC644_10720 [Ignavibacteria bacterium]
MKQIIIFTLFILSFVFFSCAKDEPVNPEDMQYVYVCSSNSAKTYHLERSCPRLKSCSEDVLEVTRKKARENERVVCTDCDKRKKKSENDTAK